MFNSLIILTGVYVSILIFVFSRQQSINFSLKLPIILSGLFLVISFILTINEIFPIHSLPFMLPKEIYDFGNKEYEETLHSLVTTNLTSANKVIILIEEQGFNREKKSRCFFLCLFLILCFLEYIIHLTNSNRSLIFFQLVF